MSVLIRKSAFFYSSRYKIVQKRGGTMFFYLSLFGSTVEDPPYDHLSMATIYCVITVCTYLLHIRVVPRHPKPRGTPYPAPKLGDGVGTGEGKVLGFFRG